MDNFVFMLKTYKNDFLYVKRLLGSFNRFNVDNIHMYIVFSKFQTKEFQKICKEELNNNIILIEEESLSQYFTDAPVNGIKEGYINQEIVKLSFWELGLCRNYMCLDSDAVFIRKFYIADFMYDEETPYSVLYEDTNLKTDPIYFNSFWVEREKYLRKIQKELEISERKIITCHGFQNFSVKVLQDFNEHFLKKKGYSYIDILRIAPYEFSWYNFWLQKRRIINIHYSGQIFYCYHMKHQLYNAWLAGMHNRDLMRSYVGIVLNSNFLDGRIVDYEGKNERIKGELKQLKSILKNIVKEIIHR